MNNGLVSLYSGMGKKCLALFGNQSYLKTPFTTFQLMVNSRKAKKINGN